MTKTKNPKVTAYEIVTEKILAALEAGVVPWHQTWSTTGLPRSASSGKLYRGVNVFLLALSAAAEGYESAFWATYDNIGKLGGQVRKGEHSTIVTFWKRVEPKGLDEEGNERKPFMLLRYFRVFNVEQADWPDGMPARFVPPAQLEHEPIDAAVELLHGYIERGPALHHGGSAAFYSPAEDRITLPPLGTFETSEAYYSTAFHEATHSTGHASRLNREGVTNIKFASHSYGFEELIAELGAAMLMGQCGLVDATIDNSASYIASWLNTIREDSSLVVKAAAAAQRAVDLVAGIEHTTTEEVAA